MESKLFINGQWVAGGPVLEVTNKYTGAVIGALPTARREDMDAAISAAQAATRLMAEMPAYRRSEILSRAAALMRENRQDLARTIAAEAGKALKFALAEVDRAISTFTFAAEEAKRIHGETIPLDATPAGEGYFGFWTRRPVGVIAAISPFNFPLNLVAHKVAPALAAGNTLVLKPASTTPLTAVKLCEILAQAGLPAGALNLVAGPGSSCRRMADHRPAYRQDHFHRQPAGRRAHPLGRRHQKGHPRAGQHIAGDHRPGCRPGFRRPPLRSRRLRQFGSGVHLRSAHLQPDGGL